MIEDLSKLIINVQYPRYKSCDFSNAQKFPISILFPVRKLSP